MFKQKILSYEKYHINENDCKIFGNNFSIKKISGKSIIALDWSKNKNNFQKEYFTSNIILFNIKTQSWYANKQIIPSGIYFIDKYYCKENVKLTKNNKTNSLIKSDHLYLMLIDCILKNNFITFPEVSDICQINILKLFNYSN